MLNLLATVLESDFLKFFIENRDLDDWSETATSWLIAAFVVSVLVAGLMMAFKGIRKYMASNIKEKTWSRGETVVLMLGGLLPVFLGILYVWYTTRDFFNIVGVTGLLKGIAFAWLLYLLFMVVGHLASPWRREII
ncbi:MAG TPA: hypothetical protein VEY11_08215 [Pyrinomonadaceae bacterium]|nr:hypothetical protein [Pyrinomonadaceae bacterium]